MSRVRRRGPVIGPRLRALLWLVFALFALLTINAAYLGGITLLEWYSGEVYQNFFYQTMFLGHLVLGLLLILPVILYGLGHWRLAHDRPNRRAVKAGYALFFVALLVLLSGLTLTRGVPLLELTDPALRRPAYWAHVITPLLCGWLFILHRLAGKRIRWRVGGGVLALAVGLTAIGLVIQAQDPRQWNRAGPESGEAYFFPSLARTVSGDFIPARSLQNDGYCQECHADTHASWLHSAHKLSSFNNPAYLFSVRNTRDKALQRDGSVQASRFCAGCHDPVPFFSGAFDDPQFDDVNHPTAHAGITCTSCHAISHLNSPRGNADYTIDEPQHYPFAFSDNELLRFVNHSLIKAKPEFHKKTFLKPLHESAEFCGTCHKVHLPEELNQYKWLRGQNHYDSYLLSGVSGHGASSFYYPPAAENNCNGCHMKLAPSDDFGAARRDDSGALTIHDHQFPSANTALATLLDLPDSVNDAHREMLEGSLRIDLFALKRGGQVDGELIAPLRPVLPALAPGETWLLETVLRTLTLGHLFTQGTADSNEVWLEIKLYVDDRLVAHSGSRDATDGSVDPWAHYVNAYVLDRDGQRIALRNAEDIFTALYNNQIPPGAADVVHYRFQVPDWARREVRIEAQLHYRKFTTQYMRAFQGEAFDGNDLPVVTIARDRLVLPVGAEAGAAAVPDIPLWQRWNDFGIGLLRKGGSGELRQAEEAFRQVATLRPGDGQLNLARVYLREGRLDEAVAALTRAAGAEPPAWPWTVTWFTGLVNQQNGYLEEAAENFRAVLRSDFPGVAERGFDFSQDYRVLNELGQTLFELAKQARGEELTETLAEAEANYRAALALDPENVAAHYGLAQLYGRTGAADKERLHRDLHATYKPDDNARDAAVAAARRRDPAADHAASDSVVYDLTAASAGDAGRASPASTGNTQLEQIH